MTVAHDPQPPRQEGALGTITDLGSKLITALPPAFVMLVLINAAFLGMILWFLSSQMDQRTALVSKLIEHCMIQAEKVDDLGAQRARLDALEHDIRVLETKKAP